MPERLRFVNQPLTRTDLRELVADCYRLLGPAETAHFVDGIKAVGFEFATRGGMTIAVADIHTPEDKPARLAAADEAVLAIDREFQRGLITDDERYEQVVEVWQKTTSEISDAMVAMMNPDDKVIDGPDRAGALWMMTSSGARGNKGNIGQLGGMRGLMADPTGRIIDVPVRSNFREGMTVLEYFISTHGARKGLADTALRTADSGYLTRRLVDVAQDVITRDEDCGTEEGTWITRDETKEFAGSADEDFAKRIDRSPLGGDHHRPHDQDGRGARRAQPGDRGADALRLAGLRTKDGTPVFMEVAVRSPLSCQARHGVCRFCYGRNLATGHLIGVGEAVGIIAAQSIGEPGTQLTMRTFHTGGVAGLDITAGLPRVEELFEARIPKGKAEISHIDGVVEILTGETGARRVKVTSREAYETPIELAKGQELLLAPGDRRDRPGHRPQRGRRRRSTRCTARPAASSSRPARASACAAKTSSSASTPSPTTPSCASRTARRSAPATPSPMGPSTRRSSSRRGARTPSSATSSRRSRRSTAARA